MAEYDIAVIGGDRRTAFMIPFFQENGYRVISFGIQETDKENADGRAHSLKEALDGADVIVGGIPLEKEGVLEIRELSRLIRKKHTIFGGVIPESFRQECSERDILCCDFMLVESIAVFNAVATAEGAVLEALRHKDTNIHKSESLVIGYGRCGKILSDKLKGLSACVTVCSNSQTELAVADAYGLRTLPLEQLESRAGEFEYIYNTAPALLLTEKLLEKIREDALIIDIASGRGGVDY
ncbi:dipicolinate synthase subunit DpsA, partial [Eisenbergiella porci]